jgi:hypothetical protein
MRNKLPSRNNYLWIAILSGISLFVLISGLLAVIYLVMVLEPNIDSGDLGTIGDFFGGLLNPILSFISIIVVAYTLMQNKEALSLSSKELKLSREEMELARKEHAKSAQAQEGLLILESKNLEEKNIFNEIENTREELKFRIKLFEDRLALKRYKESKSGVRLSFIDIMARRTVNLREDVNPGIYIELKDILFEACLMGRILKKYIDEGQDKKLGRAVCLELGIILKDVDLFLSNLRCGDLEGRFDRAVKHVLLGELFNELSEHSLLLNKKMWIDLV